MTFNFKTIQLIADISSAAAPSCSDFYPLKNQKDTQANGAYSLALPLQAQPENPPVSIHGTQIRQHTQAGNKGWVNTSPDYCQRGNMWHVLPSVLIIKEMCLEWSYKMEATVNSQWQGNIRLHRFHLFTAWHFLPSAECALTVCQWPHHLNWTHMNI